MAGTSGCIPDYHVNFFGQLCEPASHPSRMTSPETGSQIDFERQSKNVPVLPPKADHAPAPDPVAELFKKNQNLIRGLSCGNVETYLATTKDVFTAVRQSRKNACTGMPTEQCLPEHQQVGKDDKSRAECPDRHQTTNGDQHQHKLKHKHQRKEQCQVQQARPYQEHLAMRKEDQHQTQHENKHQLQPRSQDQLQRPANNFIITHYPKNKNNTRPSRQANSAKVDHSRKTIPCTACNTMRKRGNCVVES